jgi:probable O-glycosylation ligase (exosortase A-associated)
MKGLIFTYALTYGGVLASLYSPFIGLLIYVCFANIQPEYMWYWSVEPGNYSRIVAVGLLVGWALHGFGHWNIGRSRGILAVLLAFWAWAAIHTVFAQDQDIAWQYLEGQSKIFLPFLVGITTIDSTAKLKQLIWVITLSLGYVAWELNLEYLSGNNRVREFGFGGMDNNGVAIAMVTGSGMSFFLGLAAPRWWQKAVAFLATGLMVHTVLITFSRGGMIGLIVTGTYIFAMVYRRAAYCLLFGVLVAAALFSAGPEVKARFLSALSKEREELDESAQSRLDLWSACLDSMAKQPLGLGPDHWPLIAQDYGFKAGKQAHSVWMQLGAELGFPGLMLLLSFYIVCIWQLWIAKSSIPWQDPVLCAIPHMVTASLVGFIFTAQFVSLYGLELPYYIVLVGAGFLSLLSREPQSSCADEERSSVGSAQCGLS